jgi:hypothetical protein
MAFTLQPAYAGFVTTKNISPEHIAAPADANQTVHNKRQELKALIKSKISALFADDGEKKVNTKKVAWQNIASLACSSLGFLSLFMAFAGVISASGWSALAIAAILFGLLCGVGGLVFGIMGLRMRKKKWRFRGFALAGLILGCIDLFFLLIVVFLAAALSL